MTKGLFVAGIGEELSKLQTLANAAPARKTAEYRTLDQKSAENLEAAKTSLHKSSEQSGVIINNGPLEKIVPGINWMGKISSASRLNAGEIEQSDIDNAFEAANKCYVPSTMMSPVRCGDERPTQNYDDSDAEQFMISYGPQGMGACVSMAVGYSLFRRATEKGYSANILEAIDEFNSILFEAGHTAGTHGDTLAEIRGCGANRSQHTQLAIMSTGDKRFKALVKSYLGEKKFSEKMFAPIVDSATSALSQSRVFVQSPQKIIEKVCSINPYGYATKAGLHLGVGFVKNMVEGTTLHVDHLNSLLGRKVQIFNVDEWFDRKVAKVITGAQEDQLLYEHIRAAQTIATAIVLLDGSLCFGVRTPK